MTIKRWNLASLAMSPLVTTQYKVASCDIIHSETLLNKKAEDMRGLGEARKRLEKGKKKERVR